MGAVNHRRGSNSRPNPFIWTHLHPPPPSSLSPLQHGKMYWLHICARDWMNHTTCARPHQFLVDLTPPVCSTPLDMSGGRIAPPITSRRSGVSAQWDCHDPETGVAISMWMPKGNGNALLPRVFMIRGGRGDGSAAMPMVQAMHYTNCISATNFAGLASADICSGGMYYDGTAPEGDPAHAQTLGEPLAPLQSPLCSCLPQPSAPYAVAAVMRSLLVPRFPRRGQIAV